MLEYIGYVASLIVLVSLLMSSIKKLRWINLIGSVTFAIYGFLIGSLPVGLLNIGTVLINVFYLWKMYTSKDYFKILPFVNNTQYFQYFLNYYKKDLSHYASTNEIDVESSAISFYILRNIVPAGVFVASLYDKDSLKVELDYVVPEYRDFKIGKYLFSKGNNVFSNKGYHKLYSFTNNPKHEKYLLKMGFNKNDELSNDTEICFQIILQ